MWAVICWGTIEEITKGSEMKMVAWAKEMVDQRNCTLGLSSAALTLANSSLENGIFYRNLTQVHLFWVVQQC